MQLAFHKPNSKNTGFLFGFKVTKQELFIEAIRQVSWNPDTKNGSFKDNARSTDPTKKLVIKINEGEAGNILNTIQNGVPYSTVHVSSKGKTVISAYAKDATTNFMDKDYPIRQMSFNISKDGSKYSILLQPGEIECLRIFLEEFIKTTFIFELEPAQ